MKECLEKCQFYYMDDCIGIKNKETCLKQKPCWKCTKRQDITDEDCFDYGNCKPLNEWKKEMGWGSEDNS